MKIRNTGLVSSCKITNKIIKGLVMAKSIYLTDDDAIPTQRSNMARLEKAIVRSAPSQ